MPGDESRPPPEHFLALIRQQQRGRLKVYLGFAAGVGKTYEMLQEGHRLKRQGVDVVVGFVETHGRAETAALLEGLEQVPRRRVEYKGVALEEMDLDAVLRRRPTVALPTARGLYSSSRPLRQEARARRSPSKRKKAVTGKRTPLK